MTAMHPVEPARVANFPAQAERYRRQFRLFLKLTFAGMILTGAAVFGPRNWEVWVGVPAIALVFAGLITFFTLPRLRCPDCQKSAEDFDRFCPVCGADGLQRYQITAAKCGCCKRTLGYNKTRNYRIHFCTHCGEFLDRQGV